MHFPSIIIKSTKACFLQGTNFMRSCKDFSISKLRAPPAPRAHKRTDDVKEHQSPG